MSRRAWSRREIEGGSVAADVGAARGVDRNPQCLVVARSTDDRAVLQRAAGRIHLGDEYVKLAGERSRERSRRRRKVRRIGHAGEIHATRGIDGHRIGDLTVRTAAEECSVDETAAV